jgi:hypothetical protein
MVFASTVTQHGNDVKSTLCFHSIDKQTRCTYCVRPTLPTAGLLLTTTATGLTLHKLTPMHL